MLAGTLCSCENMPVFRTNTGNSVTDGMNGHIAESTEEVDDWMIKAYFMKGERTPLVEGRYLIGYDDTAFASACNSLANDAVSRYEKPADLSAEQKEAIQNTAFVANLAGRIGTYYYDTVLGRNLRWASDYKEGDGFMQELVSAFKTVTDRILAGNATNGDVVLMGEFAEIATRFGNAYCIFKDGTKRSGADLMTDEQISIITYKNGTCPISFSDIDFMATIAANTDLINRGTKVLDFLSALDGTGAPVSDRFMQKAMAFILSRM